MTPLAIRWADHKASSWLLLCALAAVAALVYVPGLSGSFVFDDSTFIVGNAGIRVTEMDTGQWVRAALSFPSGSHQGRWLGMLSFAANHYFSGLDPFWLKLTNLAIHLANSVLVFLLLRALFALRAVRRPAMTEFDGGLAAAALAGLWLVLPVNLTAVLYVSQRLESLSCTFVFLGLWLYLRVRLRYWRDGGAGLRLAVVLAACTGVGVLVKESAVMLPLYAACIEAGLAAWKRGDGRIDRSVVALHAVFLGLPLVLGSVWLLSWVGGESSYARSFDTVERLLTESRVLVHYLQWIVLPLPDSLTLYHDDFAVSHGLLQPPTTLVCILLLAGLLGAALWQRRRRPLLATGVLWFFAGHLLTGTVIPLMLVMEHRNYFPSVGLLLACGSLVALEGGLRRTGMRVALLGGALAFYAFTTWMRAEEWSDPLRLAVSEANKRPSSSAAQYELGRTLLMSHRNGKPMMEEGFAVLEKASRLPAANILHEQLLIVAHSYAGEPVEQRWWESLISKLESRPPTASDIDALAKLYRCLDAGVCAGHADDLRRAFEAALAHPRSNSVLVSAYGEFCEKILGDSATAERQFRRALQLAPSDPKVRSNLIMLLAHHGQTDKGRRELVAMRRLNHFGALTGQIEALEHFIAEEAGKHPSASRSNPAAPARP